TGPAGGGGVYRAAIRVQPARPTVRRGLTPEPRTRPRERAIPRTRRSGRPPWIKCTTTGPCGPAEEGESDESPHLRQGERARRQRVGARPPPASERPLRL